MPPLVNAGGKKHTQPKKRDAVDPQYLQKNFLLDPIFFSKRDPIYHLIFFPGSMSNVYFSDP